MPFVSDNEKIFKKRKPAQLFFTAQNRKKTNYLSLKNNIFQPFNIYFWFHIEKTNDTRISPNPDVHDNQTKLMCVKTQEEEVISEQR